MPFNAVCVDAAGSLISVKLPLTLDKALPCAVRGVVVSSRDYAIIVDLCHDRVSAPRIINRGELSLLQNKPVFHVAAIGVSSRNHAVVVDSACDRGRLIGIINAGVLSSNISETVENTLTILITPYNSPVNIDSRRRG